MEYLDLLLARGERYQDLAGRIQTAITARTDMPRTEPTELAEATADQIASAAGDLMFGDLFGRLGTAARSLLIRASVFRVPVTAEALGARPGPIAECEAAGLLVIGPGHELVVHRWTAGAPHRHWPRLAWAPSWPRRTGRRLRTGCPAVPPPRNPATTSAGPPN